MMGPENEGIFTYIHAILKMGISAIFEYRLMLSPLMRKTGRMAKVKSQVANMADITYVKSTMISMLRHVPASPKARLQKYCTGLHWKVVKRPKNRPVSTLVYMTMWMIRREVRLVMGVMRRKDKPTETFAPIMVRLYEK